MSASHWFHHYTNYSAIWRLNGIGDERCSTSSFVNSSLIPSKLTPEDSSISARFPSLPFQNFMSEKNQPITKQDAVYIQEDEQKQEDNHEQLKPILSQNGGDEGYKTPDAAENRIPGLSSSCSPPPPPRKRKKVFLHREKLPKRAELFENTSQRNKEELELFFRSLPEDSSVSPEPATKKRRIDDK